MKTAIPVLTSAMLALAGPALAGHSTPQEREATRQLNLEAAQQAKNTNQQLAAATTTTNTQTQSMPAQSAPAAAPTTPVESAPAAEANQNAGPAANPAAPAQ